MLHWIPTTTLSLSGAWSGSYASPTFLRNAACHQEPAREQLLPVTVSSCCRAAAVPLQEDIGGRPGCPHEAVLSQVLQALLNAEQVRPALLRERHEVVAAVRALQLVLGVPQVVCGHHGSIHLQGGTP